MYFTLLMVNLFVAGNSKPNFLFIIVDDLRPVLGAYNDKNSFTPNIDKLAENSVLFNNTFAQQSLCGPSRISMLTGRRPDTLRLYDTHYYWRKSIGNFSTFPQFFKGESYMTHSIGKVFHPGAMSNYNDDYPYSWSLKPFHSQTEHFKRSSVCPIPNSNKLFQNIVCPVQVHKQPLKTLPDLEILNESISFLKNYSQKPYFLAVGFHKPHIPLKFPSKFLSYHSIDKFRLPKERAKSDLLPNVSYNPWQDLRERDDIKNLNLSFPYEKIPDHYSKSIIQSYYASVTYIDSLIGTLLKYVNRSNTVIILTSDHGWSLSEHGEWSKYSNYDVAVRVPLLISIPKITEKGFIKNQIVELIDIFPTLVHIYDSRKNLKPCQGLEVLCTEGQSLYPLIIKTRKKRLKRKRFALSQYPRPSLNPQVNSDQPKLNDIQYMGYSIRTKNFRYTRWMKFRPADFRTFWNETYGEELYDHRHDSSENRNEIINKSLVKIKADLSRLLKKTIIT